VDCVGRTGDRHAGHAGEDGRAELAPESKELGERPVASEIVSCVTVEVGLIADLDAEQRRAELLGSVGNLVGRSTLLVGSQIMHGTVALVAGSLLAGCSLRSEHPPTHPPFPNPGKSGAPRRR
jgi:hypothetical protein